MSRTNINFRSIDQLSGLVVKSLPTLPKDIELVVAVPRSGYIVAACIALNLNVKMCSYNEYINGITPMGGQRTNTFSSPEKTSKKVLIVDDSVSTGWEMNRLRKQIAESDITDEVIFLAAYVTSAGMPLVDIALEELNPPQIFEWNIYHHPHLKSSFMDLNNVLALSTDETNPIDFKSIDSRVIPTVKIGTVISDFPEQHREVVELWLKQHNIDYNELLMPPITLSEAELRKFKSQKYADSSAFFYITSDIKTADFIFEQTGKAAYCAEERVFINAQLSIKDHVKKRKDQLKRSIKSKLFGK